MSIITRFGEPCTLVREAVIADIKTFENRRTDREDRERHRMHMRFIAARSDGREFLADLAFLRATDGWKEILDEAAKIQPALRPELEES